MLALGRMILVLQGHARPVLRDGGTGLAMIDRHYGHPARDGREHAIKLLDTYRAPEPVDVHAVDSGTSHTVPRRPR